MLRIYLDTCSIQRPLDTLNQTRLRLEAEAVLGVLERIQAGEVQLISSTVLELEVSRSSLPTRREHGLQVLKHANTVAIIDETAAQRAVDLAQRGVKAMDALHLAAAEAAGADYLCTCDDRLLRRARSLPDLRTRVVSPLELIEALES